MYRSFNKDAFTKALQELLPEIQKNDLIDGGSGWRRVRQFPPSMITHDTVCV